MKLAAPFFTIFAGLAVPAAMVGAAEVVLTLDPAAAGTNQADFTVSTPGFPPLSDSSDVSGTLAADVAIDGGTASSIEFLSTSDIGFTDVLLTVDIAGNPIILELAPGSTGTLVTTDLGGGQYGLVLTSDITFSGRVDENPIIDLTVTGTLVARGIVAIPEPASATGLAAGLGLVTLRRRRRADRL